MGTESPTLTKRPTQTFLHSLWAVYPTAMPWVLCLLPFALQFLFSATLIAVFQQSFRLRLLVIPLHLALVFSIAATVLLALLFFVRCFTRRTARFLVAGTLFSVSYFLLLLYAGDYLANVAWGHNLTLPIILASLPHILTFAQSTPIPPWLLYALVAILSLACLAFVLILTPACLSGLDAIGSPTKSQTRLTPKRILLVVSGLALGYAGLFWALQQSLASKRNLWEGEPLVALFRPSALFAGNARREQIAAVNRQVRANYPTTGTFEAKNVILLLSDSLRADHMQVNGYNRDNTPFLASLDAQGRLHKAKIAVSAGSESLCGVMSVLASTDWTGLSYYNFLLSDLLRLRGYKTYFILSADNSSWYGYREMLGRNVDLFFDGTMSKKYPMNDDRLAFEALDKIPNYNGTPAMFFFFLMSTHLAGAKLDEYNRYKPSRVDPATFEEMYWTLSGKFDHESATNRYDNGVLQADAIMQRIFSVLEEKGYLKNALSVISADHGEGLGEHGHYIHSRFLYHEDTGIPIIFVDDPNIAYPGLGFATQADIAPTILARLGLPAPSSWKGQALLSPDSPRFSIHTTLRAPVTHALISWDGKAALKYLHTPVDKQGVDANYPVEQVFDLSVDPGETNNIIEAIAPDLLARFREKESEIGSP